MIKRIKAKLYAIFFWQTNIGEYLNKIYDLRIFMSNSFTSSRLKNKESYKAFLTKQYHIIEKGLALPNPRENFGKSKIMLLIEKTKGYIHEYGTDGLITSINDTLLTYLNRNSQLEKKDKDFYIIINEFLSNNSNHSNSGGLKYIGKEYLDEATNIDFEAFVKSRTSVRNFSSEEVLIDEVYKAVEIAKYAPSVCNRQSWKVHYFGNKVIKNKLLSLQNGNNGFTESINKVLIITSDTKKFTKLEGNQVFVDGGLFAMNMLLSLHSLGIASCCLNTCLPYVDEKKIKVIGKIPSSERLIMMIGIGKYKDSFEVAISNRVLAEEIVEKKE
jgi:nitroreductase